MEELYEILERLLSAEHKVQSLRNVLEMLAKSASETEQADIQSVLSVSLDSLDCIKAELGEGVTAFDLFIANNASRYRGADGKNKKAR